MKYSSKEKFVIIGLGITGFSSFMFLKKKGIVPKIMDTRYQPPYLNKISKDIPCCLGKLKKKWILEATIIIVSPGFSLNHPLLKKAKKKKIKIINDIEIFSKESTVPIVAITGSNGKSTVVHMIKEITNYANIKAEIGGNIGIPVLSLLNIPSRYSILELSSFQLESIYSLKTVVSTILNISEDHIDRYPLGLKEYHDVKLKIYNFSSICLFNSQDSLTFPKKYKKRNCISFGLKNADYTLSKYKNSFWITAYGSRILDCKEMKIIGIHNYINALTALALSDIIGISRFNSIRALKKFNGLPHRLEIVHKKNGITWINDSKSTNIHSTQAALQAIKLHNVIHLLLGGDSKSADLSQLKIALNKKKIQIYCFGKDKKKLSSLFSDIEVTVTDTLTQSMHIINDRVKTGDVVLLSPACSSQDQFKNFEERGKIFTKLAIEK